MNVTVKLKPAPHCEIPLGHPLFAGYVPAERTDIRRTFAKAAPRYGDDYDLVHQQDWLSAPGGWR